MKTTTPKGEELIERLEAMAKLREYNGHVLLHGKDELHDMLAEHNLAEAKTLREAAEALRRALSPVEGGELSTIWVVQQNTRTAERPRWEQITNWSREKDARKNLAQQREFMADGVFRLRRLTTIAETIENPALALPTPLPEKKT
jgi:hypothetical protein